MVEGAVKEKHQTRRPGRDSMLPLRAVRHSNSETAGGYLTAAVPRAGPNETCEQVKERLGQRQFECLECIWVTDPDDRLLGAISLADLLASAPESAVTEHMRSIPTVQVDEDQEKLASLALHHRLSTIPVLDHGGRFLGVVPPLPIMHVLRHEHVEDLHRLAGIRRETRRAREAIESAPVRRARDRLPWLLLGLVGSAITTQVMAQFEQELQGRVAIAFFIPGLVYIADAIGTQTEAVAVRGLSLSHVSLRHLLGAEIRTGLLIGITLAILTLPATWLAFGDLRLAIAVSAALFAAGCIATTIGLFLPWLLGQLGNDPAYGSGPLATILQDVMSIIIYFAIVNLLLF